MSEQKSQKAKIADRAVSSREAVEAAIEKSKDSRRANWEKTAPPGRPIPKWAPADKRVRTEHCY